MGNFCYSKNKKTHGPIEVRIIEINEIYYKPKISSNSLICYKPKNKTFWEETLQSEIRFQNGTIFGQVGDGVFLCIGGLEQGDFASKILVSDKKLQFITPPPLPLAYGFLHKHEDSVFIIGAVSQTASGNEMPAPCLHYNLRTNKWDFMPNPPVVLALAGSYMIDNKIFVIGGFENYPNNPTPFSGLFLFNCSSMRWASSSINTPIYNGLPICVVTPAGVIIAGGYDPFDRCVIESRDVYMFSGNSFTKLNELPEVGQLRFTEPGAYLNSEVHLYSEDEILFSYSLSKNSWSFVDLEEKLTVGGEVPMIRAASAYGDYVYFYSQKDCDLLEYSISSKSSKATGPSTFHKFPKYPGIGLLSDGRLLIAGGLDEEQVLKNCWVLEPQFHQSAIISDLPQLQYGLNILQISREIYAMAGVCNQVSMCQKYSLDTEKWTVLPNMPFCTFLPGCGYINGKIYCMGGCAEEEGATILYLVQAFSVSTEIWEVLNVEYPFGVLAIGVANINSNKLLCFGGICKGGYKVINTYFFDGNRFSLVSELPEDDDSEATCFRDPCVINGNYVYAFARNAKLYKFDLQESIWTLEYPSTRA